VKTTLVIGALAAGLGVAGAGYMLLAGDDGATETQGTPARAGKRTSARAEAVREDRSDWATEDRVAELELEVAELRRQMRAMQLRGAVSGFGGSDELDPSDPGISDSVREIVAREREREREQDLERRRARMQERTEEALDELVSKAGIDDQQREKVAALWAAERDQMSALWNESRDGDGDPRAARDQARAMRRATDEQAKSMLDAQQYEIYEQLRPRGPGGGRGGRGPGAWGPNGEGPRPGASDDG